MTGMLKRRRVFTPEGHVELPKEEILGIQILS